jgi:hypothetical protein
MVMGRSKCLRRFVLEFSIWIIILGPLDIQESGRCLQSCIDATFGGTLIGSTYRLPCIDTPRIDMPRFGYTCRFHTFLGHVT